jgi:hypothetical protein
MINNDTKPPMKSQDAHLERKDAKQSKRGVNEQKLSKKSRLVERGA